MFQRLLVPWDGSELADRALGVAVDLAVAYEAEIVAISVITGGDGADRLAAEFEERAREDADGAGVPISHAVAAGRHPAAALLDYAHEHGFDLIVIGHHRDPHRSALALHGVTQHLLAAAAVPILVVAS